MDSWTLVSKKFELKLCRQGYLFDFYHWINCIFNIFCICNNNIPVLRVQVGLSWWWWFISWQHKHGFILSKLWRHIPCLTRGVLPASVVVRILLSHLCLDQRELNQDWDERRDCAQINKIWKQNFGKYFTEYYWEVHEFQNY